MTQAVNRDVPREPQSDHDPPQYAPDRPFVHRLLRMIRHHAALIRLREQQPRMPRLPGLAVQFESRPGQWDEPILRPLASMHVESHPLGVHVPNLQREFHASPSAIASCRRFDCCGSRRTSEQIGDEYETCLWSSGRFRGFLLSPEHRMVHRKAAHQLAYALQSTAITWLSEFALDPDMLVDAESMDDVLSSLNEKLGPPQPDTDTISEQVLADAKHSVPNVWYVERPPFQIDSEIGPANQNVNRSGDSRRV